MLKNYFKTALRSLLRYKIYSFINVAGLALGLASFLMIFLYVENELSYDKFNKNYEDVYRVVGDGYARTPASLAAALKNDFPEIRNTARIAKTGKVLMSMGEKRFYEENGFLGDPSILQVFTFPLISGNPNKALMEPLSILLTQETAKKYYGSENPIGKVLRYDDKYDLKVTGVLRDVPANSHFHFDFLISMSTANDIYGKDFLTNTLNTTVYTYVQLENPNQADEIQKGFLSFVKKYYAGFVESMKPTLSLQPLSSIHLYSNLGGEIEPNGDIKYIYLFSAVGMLILFMACINYMNILTARYSSRIKEIGVRKVLGANQLALIRQFIGESILTAFISLVVAVVLLELFLPAISSLIDRTLTLEFKRNFWLIAAMIGVPLIAGIISGSYPAFILSSFHPSQIFRKTSCGQFSGSSVIRILVIFQFLISTSLIISTVIISDQLHYIRNKNLGFDKENIVVLPLREDNTRKHYEVLKSALLRNTSVSSVSASSVLPGDVQYYTSVKWNENGWSKTMDFIYADYDFIKTYKMEIEKGRDFSKSFGGDLKGAYILNETAIKNIGWKNPIGKRFQAAVLNEGKVIGVVKDFNYKSLRKKIDPLFIAVNPDNLNYLSVRISAKNTPASLNYIRDEWIKIFPESPFEYFFFDSHLDALYKSESKLASMFDWFSALAIIIACLGLFGLASISTIKRTKEIGIRKVLGAPVIKIVGLISKEFILLVLIANLIAWPLTWYGVDKWLHVFAYRINLQILTFLFVSCGIMAMVLFVVALLAIKAANAKPVESLRYE